MPHKKNHSWKDLASETGNTLKKGALHIKKKWQSDANPVQQQLNKNANIANTGSGKKTAGGRIQKKLVEAGHSKSDLRRLGEKHKASQANRKKMDNLRKTNPEKYKKLKKEERRKANIAAMKSRSSSWD
tara:strand:- start:55 stop:441 length:387 start_codon:yes stop_codon:yes gene_type:complete